MTIGIRYTKINAINTFSEQFVEKLGWLEEFKNFTL